MSLTRIEILVNLGRRFVVLAILGAVIHSCKAKTNSETVRSDNKSVDNENDLDADLPYGGGNDTEQHAVGAPKPNPTAESGQDLNSDEVQENPEEAAGSGYESLTKDAMEMSGVPAASRESWGLTGSEPVSVIQADLNVTIPDNDPAGVTRTLAFNSDGTIENIAVEVEIDRRLQSYSSDFKIYLIHPDATSVQLAPQSVQSSDTGAYKTNARYYFQAPALINVPRATNASLGAFVGKGWQGDWRIRVENNYATGYDDFLRRVAVHVVGNPNRSEDPLVRPRISHGDSGAISLPFWSSQPKDFTFEMTEVGLARNAYVVAEMDQSSGVTNSAVLIAPDASEHTLANVSKSAHPQIAGRMIQVWKVAQPESLLGKAGFGRWKFQMTGGGGGTLRHVALNLELNLPGTDTREMPPTGQQNRTVTVNPGTRIFDHQTQEVEIVVPPGGTIDDLSVGLDITHTYTGDLTVELLHPRNGESPGDKVVGAILLHGRTGGGTDDIVRVFGGAAGSPFPNNSFEQSNVRGLDSGGTWILRVSDSGNGDTGTINSVSLSLEAGNDSIFDNQLDTLIQVRSEDEETPTLTVDSGGNFRVIVNLDGVSPLDIGSKSLADCAPLQLSPLSQEQTGLINCRAGTPIADQEDSWSFPNGNRVLDANDRLFYESGTLLADLGANLWFYEDGSLMKSSHGHVYWPSGIYMGGDRTEFRYPDGALLRRSGELVFQNGEVFSAAKEVEVFYAQKTLLKSAGEGLRYPNGQKLADRFELYYANGNLVRRGPLLFDEAGGPLGDAQAVLHRVNQGGAVIDFYADAAQHRTAVVQREGLGFFVSTLVSEDKAVDPIDLTAVEADLATPSIQLSWEPAPNSSTVLYRMSYQEGTPPENCSSGTVVGESVLTNKTTYTVEGLKPNTNYGFRLCAKNSFGFLSDGATVEGRSGSEAPPPAASGLAEKVGDRGSDRVTLEWNAAPAGSTLRAFYLTYQAGTAIPECSGGSSVEAGTATTKQVTGLSPGTAYSFRLCGRNGSTPPAVSSGPGLTVTTYKPTPDNPATVTFSDIQTRSATVDWPAVQAADSYQVAYSTSTPAASCTGATVNATNRSATLTGLTPSTQYHVRVCSKTNGAQELSSGKVATFTTKALPPPAPQGFAEKVADREDTRLTLQWNAAPSGSSLTAFHLAYRVGTSAPSCTSGTRINVGLSTSKVITGLSPWTNYAFRICSSNGNSPPDVTAGSTVVVRTYRATPANPGNLSLSAITTNSMQVSWQGVTAADGYRIVYSSGSTPLRCTGSAQVQSSTTLGLTGLQPNTSYQVRVCSTTNGAKQPSIGATITRTTKDAVPDDPRYSSDTVRHERSIQLSWRAPSSPRYNVSGYLVSWAKDSAPATCGSAGNTHEVSSASAAIAGLEPGTLYGFRICTKNSNNPPDLSNGMTVTIRTLYPRPPQPRNVRISNLRSRDAFLSWESGGVPTASYRVLIGQAYECAGGSATGLNERVLVDLSVDTAFTVSVCAISDKGRPSLATTVSFRTQKIPPREFLGVLPNGNVQVVGWNGANLLSPSAIIPLDWDKIVVADLDSDRISDLIAVDASGSLHAYPGREDGFGPVVANIGTFDESVHTIFADFTDDGLTDMLTIDHAGIVQLTPLMNGTFSIAHRVTLPGRIFFDKLVVGDFDGDFAVDLLAISNAGNADLYLWKDGSYETVLRNILGNLPSSDSEYFSGDFTGDGKEDLLVRTAAATLSLYPSLGTGFDSPLVEVGPQISYDRYFVNDFDNDGLADIAGQNFDGTVRLHLWRTTEFATAIDLHADFTSYSSVLLGAFRESGKPALPHHVALDPSTIVGGVACAEDPNCRGPVVFSGDVFINAGPSGDATIWQHDIVIRSGDEDTVVEGDIRIR